MSKLQIDIDPNSGFCFGVVNAVKKAENQLQSEGHLYSLGKIVHNQAEVDRLNSYGLEVVNEAAFGKMSAKKVLFRAHGEPPIRYQQAKENQLEIIDGTCPVVLKLQERIRKAYALSKAQNGQLVIFGKKGHAEVNGLVGQTNNEAIVVQTEDDLDLLDLDKAVWLFAQTTQSIEGFQNISEAIKERVKAEVKVHDTICRQVANRAPKLQHFVGNYELVFFVSGADSSNGKYLYGVCKKVNTNTHFISDIEDLDINLLTGVSKIGICGATSTPQWQMEGLANKIDLILSK